MKKLYFILFVVLFNFVLAQPSPLGIFDSQTDVGHPKTAGTGKYDAVTHSYDVKGGGYNIGLGRDEFHFIYKKIKGDFTATANFDFTGTSANTHRRAGWMLRQSFDDKAPFVDALEQGDGLTIMQWRTTSGQIMKDLENEIYFPDKNFETVQLQRIGKKFIMRVAHVGEDFQTVGAHEEPNMPDEAYIGLVVCAHDASLSEEARIWDVRVEPGTPPAPAK
jgi:TolB protein